MRKGFFISRAAVVSFVVVGVVAVVVIVALTVAYCEEKTRAGAPPTGEATAGPVPPTPAPAPKEPWQRYRLPGSLWPLSYNVTLWPRLTPDGEGAYTFAGNSTVAFRCLRATALILLHCSKLNLSTFGGHLAQLRGLHGARAPPLSRTWLERPTQYLVVQLDRPLTAGAVYQLHTRFVGELADDLAGFYRSEYMADGEQRWAPPASGAAGGHLIPRSTRVVPPPGCWR